MEIAEEKMGVIPLEIRLLGAFAVQVHGKPLARLRSRQGQWLLGMLVLRHGRETEREWLASTLWPESSPEQALYNLRRNLTDLRQALGPEGDRLPAAYSRTLQLDLTGAQVDVLEFDAAIQRGDTASLEQAAALYRGALLEGCAQDWIVPEREAREQSYLSALEMLAAHSLACHDPAAAAGYLRKSLAVDPLRETALRALLEALAARGEYAAMTQAYRDFRLYLHRELNAEPAEETALLYQQLKRQAGEPLTAAAAPTSSPRHLPRPLTSLIGRELELQEVIACLKAARLLTLTGTGGVGKTRLAIAAAETVANDYADGVRFIDLTALTESALIAPSIAAALDVKDKPHCDPLDNLADQLQSKQLLLILDNCEHLIAGCAESTGSLLSRCPGLRVLATSRQSLGLMGEISWRVPPLPCPPPLKSQPPNGQGVDHSGIEKDQAAILLEYPAVQLFVECARRIRPDLQMTPTEASTIAQICRRLDGIPLAIELAAARVRALPIAEIDVRLENRFGLLTGGNRGARPHHQTLEALIDWSYTLLSAPEQRLLQRLSIFSGGWTLDAAEQVCSAAGVQVFRSSGVQEMTKPTLSNEFQQTEESHSSQPEYLNTRIPEHLKTDEVLDLLTSLVDKSLVVYEEQAGLAWYRLLDTVRQYCQQRLAGDEEERQQVSSRHAAYYLSLAEQADAQIMGPEQERWLSRLEREHDNLRAAMDWCLNTGKREKGKGERKEGERGRDGEGEKKLSSNLKSQVSGLALAGALWRFWWLRGHLYEGRERLKSFLQQNGTDHPTPELALALCGAGNLAQCQGDYSAAIALFEQALSVERALGNTKGEADMLFHLGDVATNQGDYARAHFLLEQALAMQRELGDRHGEGESLGRLGYIAREQGDFVEASSLMEAALAIQRELGDRMNEVWNLGSLGYVYHGQGDHARARATFAAALEIYRAFGNRAGEAWSLTSLGFIACVQSDYASARPLLDEAMSINLELGNLGGEAWRLDVLSSVLRGQGDYRGARSTLEQALIINRRIGSRKSEASNLRHLGDIAREEGDAATARRYYIEAAALMRELGIMKDQVEFMEAYLASLTPGG